MTTLLVNVTGWSHEGTTTVLLGTTHDGAPVLVAADARMARAIIDRLAAGDGPVPVTVEPWQIIAGGSEA